MKSARYLFKSFINFTNAELSSRPILFEDFQKCRSFSSCRKNYSSTITSSTKTTRNLSLKCLKNTQISPLNIRSIVTSQKIVEVSSARMDEQKLLTKEERAEFMSLFPEIIQILTGMSEHRDMQSTNQWLSRVFKYNVSNGKMNRGLATALAYRYLAQEITEEGVRNSYILGWCVEILQAFFLVADDIMDKSETRRGKPCWYKVDNLGEAAVNDAIMLESCIYPLLKKFFKGKECYADLMENFHDVTFKTIYGQSLDTRTGLERKMEDFKLDLYSSIVKYKTSFYSFYLPVCLAMSMTGINDQELIRQAKSVTLEMGHFFQVQDDYLDCFGDHKVTGKIGTDIADYKCSWLIVIALQRATEEQKEILKENYGKNDPECVEKVKQLYIDMGLPETYHVYEEQNYNLINNHIKQMSPGLPKQLFYDMLSTIYRRSS